MGAHSWLLYPFVIMGCAKAPTQAPKMNDSDINPPHEVTKAVFDAWRDARRGKSHPERLDNPYWEWLMRTDEISAFAVNDHFDGPSSYGGSPVWEANRLGQSSTKLADGREVLIAGEHEDYYDPDFFIYNDVTIRHPGGRIEFLGYPEDVFPPTDFHSATLLGHQIILIGNLGYTEKRQPGTCQIVLIDTATWKIARQSSSGDSPGWLHDHSATLAEDGKSILVQGGIVFASPDEPMIENIDEWRLHLGDWRWERLTKRQWPLFEISRQDGEGNQLWEMRHALWKSKLKMNADTMAELLGDDADPVLIEAMKEDTPALPQDREALESLYQPASVAHTQIPENEDEFGVSRIKVGDVIVRYVESSYEIMLTVEGDLPKDTIAALKDDLIDKLGKIDGGTYRAIQHRP